MQAMVMIPISSPYSIRSCPASSRMKRVFMNRIPISPSRVPATAGRDGLRRPCCFPQLRQVGIQRREVRGDLRTDRLDRRDAADGDDADEQAVFDQVLPRVIADE